MLPITQAVWRHLLHHARDGDRAWSSLGVLASDLDLGVSTVHKSLAHPVEIGAVEVSRLGGVELLDPLRLLMLFAAARRLQRDVVMRRRTVPMPAPWLERIASESGLTVGGCGAITSHLEGNPITTYSVVVVYGDPRSGSRRSRPAMTRTQRSCSFWSRTVGSPGTALWCRSLRHTPMPSAYRAGSQPDSSRNLIRGRW